MLEYVLQFFSRRTPQQITVSLVVFALELSHLEITNDQQALPFPHLAFGISIALILAYGNQYLLNILIATSIGFAASSIWHGFQNQMLINASAFILTYLGCAFFHKKRTDFLQKIQSANHYFSFIYYVCLLPALIYTSLRLILDHLLQNEVPSTASLLLSHLTGSLLVTPILCDFFLKKADHLPRPNKLIYFGLSISTIALGAYIFLTSFTSIYAPVSKPFWIIFIFAIVSLYMTFRMTILLLSIVSLQALIGAYFHLGFFANDSQQNIMLNCGLFLTVMLSGTLSISFFSRNTRLLTASFEDKVKQLRLKEKALDAISQGVLITDAKRKITYANQAFLKLSQYDIQDLTGNSCAILQGRESSQNTINIIKENLAQEKTCHVEILNYRKNGEAFWNDLSISPVFDEDGNLSQFVGVQNDITWRKNATHEATLASVVFENSPNGILILNSQKEVVLSNKKAYEITGYALDEYGTRICKLLNSDPQIENANQPIWNHVTEFIFWENEIKIHKKDGSVFPCHIRLQSILDSDNHITNFIVILHDLTQEKVAEERIQRLLFRDHLTGLPNIDSLRSSFDNNIKLNKGSPLHAAILLLDIDHFQYVNDTLGHKIGDLLLIEVSKKISQLLSDENILARQGGDEFLILLPRTTQHGAAIVAQEILNAFIEPFIVQGHKLTLSTSIGLALYPKDGITLESIRRCADIALNKVKKNGKKAFAFHDDDMSREIKEFVSLELDLLDAIEKEEFALLYQALVDLQSGHICGFEALIQWRHPRFGEIPASKFIPIAEESGAINKIGAWIIRQVCIDIRSALDAGQHIPPIAINFSPELLRDPQLFKLLENLLNTYQLTPRNFRVDITESALMDNANTSQAALNTLRNLGFSLSLDDFGTGYSSLSYLKTFPFDIVKIDQSFVKGLQTNSQDAAIVMAIISMSHSLGIRVIAEGVDSEFQCQFLRDNMIDEIQGSLFSEPMTWEQACNLLNSNQRLANHLLRNTEEKKTLLLVDDEQNIVNSLKRLLRRDGYEIVTANSGEEGLMILGDTKVDVIISDQRMPGMTGVEFLSKVKETHPETIRIVLSGYTELSSITDAINQGAVFRFLTKPWQDESLRDNIKEAFVYKELADKNLQLTRRIQTSNYQLASANRQLAELINKKQKQINIHSNSLNIIRETLQYSSIAMIGIDDAQVVAFINDAAIEIFAEVNLGIGDDLPFILPEMSELLQLSTESIATPFMLGQNILKIRWHNMGAISESNGKLLLIEKSPVISSNNDQQSTINLTYDANHS